MGSGPHACPGRLMVQEVLKVICINLVTKYDIKYVEGIDSRAPDYPQHTDSMPNLMAGLLFKEGLGYRAIGRCISPHTRL